MSNLVPNSVRIFLLIAATALFATSSEAAVLYTQTAGASGVGQTSQQFGPANDTFSNQGADDFIVPGGGWTIRSFDFQGDIFNDPAPANFQLITDVHVVIYNDAAGQPGSVVDSFPDLVPAFQDTLGNFTVNLPCAVNLPAGTYWVSVFVDQDFATFGQWGWNTTTVATNGFAVWRNPGNGFASGCTSWTTRSACLASLNPDNVFVIHDSFQACINTFPYNQDFEACAAHWQSGIIGGALNSWMLNTPSGTVLNSAATPGVNSWWTSGGTPIPGGENTFVQSPCFDFSGLVNPEIVIDINDDANNAGLNGAVLQASTDGGTTWINVGSSTSSTITTLGPSANWFNATALAGNGAGNQNAAHWSGLGGGWTTAHHLLTNAAGTVSLGGQSEVLLRIAFHSNFGIAGEGFAFDNIIIREGPVVDLQANFVVSPNTACGLSNSETVGVELENLGTVAQTGFNVTYQIVGPNGDTTTENVGAFNIGAGAIDTFFFATPFDASLAGDYDVTVIVTAAGDADNSNDTATGSFSNLVVPADPTALQNDTICGLDTLCMTASGTNLTWWDAQMGGAELFRGDTLYVVNPSATDTFWVSNNTLTEDSLGLQYLANNGALSNFVEVDVANGIILQGLYGNCDVAAGNNSSWTVWYRPGGLTAGNMSSNVGWTQIVSTTTAVSGGTDVPTLIASNIGLNLPAGTHSFYIINDDNSINYTNGTVLGAVAAADGELTVYEGYGENTLFSGGQFSPRVYNGAFLYEIPGCESNRLPVLGVVETADPITIANDTSICGIPGPVDFTAISAGSYTYTWTGTANSGVAGSFIGNPLTTTPSVGSSQVFVEGVDGNGCVARDTASIFAASIMIDSITGGDSICPGDSTNLSIALSGAGLQQIQLLFEDFEGLGNVDPGVMPPGWTRNNTIDPNWRPGTTNGGFMSSSGTGPAFDHTTLAPGGGVVFMETSGGTIGDTGDLVTPPIDLSGLATAELSFWYYMHGTNIDRFGVQISTDGGNSWTNEFLVIGQQQPVQTDPWLQGTVNLGAYLGETVLVRFYGINVACCSGDIALDDVSVFGSPAQISWTPAGSLSNPTGSTTAAFPTTTTTYLVTATDTASGCFDTASYTLVVRTPPAPPVAADSSRCGDGTVLMTAVGSGGLLQWFDASGNAIGAGSPVASPIVGTDTAFFVNETDVFGCVSEYDTANITVFGADSISLTATDTLVCDSGTITLTATQQGSLAYSYNFNWSETAGGGLTSTLGAIVTAEPTQSATYTVTGSDLGGSGCQAIATIDVAFGNTPNTFIVADPDTICEGDTAFLDVDGAEYTVVSVDTVVVLLTNGTASIPFNVPNGGDIISATVDLRITGDLGITNGEFGNFNIGASTVVNGIRYASTSDCQPMLPATFAAGSPLVGTIDVTSLLQGNPTVNYELDFSVATTAVNNICAFNSQTVAGALEITTTVSVRQPWGVSWSPTAGLSDPNIFNPAASPSTSTSYVVTITDSASGCFALDTADITVIPAPGKPVAEDTSRCGTGTVPLIATAGAGTDSMQWFDLAGNYIGTGSSIISPIIASTTDFVVLPYGGFCPGEADTMTATVITADSISLSVYDTTVCGPNIPVTITATQQGSLAYTYVYSWSIDNGVVIPAVGNPVVAGASSNATVTVTGSDAGSGCAYVETMNINVEALPIVTATVDDDSVCVGDTVNLSATANVDPFNYSVSSIGFDTIPGTGTNVTLGDDAIALVPIGFNFEFYGVTYSGAYISSNGFLSFTNVGNGCCSGQNIPNAAIPNNLVAFNWEDLNPTAGGSVDYFTTGVAPNRVFVMNFRSVSHFGGCGTVSAQVQLHEATGNIEIHGARVDACGGITTMGVENSTGTLATAVPGRNASTGWSGTNEAWLFSPPVGVGYQWTPMAGLGTPDTLNTTAVVSASTQYVIAVTDSTTGCTGYDSVDVFTFPVPLAPISAGFDVCGAQSVTLVATPAVGVNFDSVFYYILPADTLIGNGLAVTTPIIQDTTSFRIVESNNGCEGSSTIITINVDSAAPITIMPSDTFICDTTATVTLTASSTAPYNYTWTGPEILSGQGTNTIVVGPNATAAYTVSGTDPNPPNCQNVAFANVAVGAPPVFTATPEADTICEGDTVQLDVAGAQYTVVTVDSMPIFVTDGSTTLNYTVPNGGDIVSATVSFRLTGDHGSTGENGNFNIDGNTVVAAMRYNGGDCNTTLLPATQLSGSPAIGTVDVTSLLQGNATVDLEWDLSVSTVAVNNICNFGPFPGIASVLEVTMTIEVRQPWGVAWTPSAGLSDPNIYNPLASPSASTQYVVTITDSASGCFSMDTVDIEVVPTPGLPTAFDSTRCGVGTVELTASAVGNADSLRWFDMAGNFLGNGSPLTSPIISDTTQFQVAEYTNGCDGPLDTMTANVIPADSIAIMASDTSVCGSGTTVTFMATQIGGSPYTYTYTWTGNQMIDSLGPNASAIVDVPGTYMVTGTDTSLGTGCANTASIFINANPLPMIATDPVDSICDGDTAFLAVTGGATQATVVDVVPQLLLDVAMPGTVSTPYTVPNGGNITSAFVSIRQAGDFDIGGTEFADFSIDGTPVALSVSTTGQCTQPTLQQTVTNIDVTALLLGNPTVNLESFAPAASNFCDANFEWVLTISVPTNVVYSWTPTANLDDPTSRTPNATPSTSTQYVVQVTDTLTGCISYDTTDVIVTPIPGAPVAVDTSRCGVGTVPLVATAAGVSDSLNWFDLAGNLLGTGSPITSPVLTSNDQFRVAEIINGCEGPSDTADVTVIPADTITISASDTQVCGVGPTVTLTANQTGSLAYSYNYSWSASASGGLNATSGNPVTATPTAVGTQTYVVVGSDAGSGCANTDTIEVEVEAIPTVTATVSPDSVCSGDPVNLSGTTSPSPTNYSVTSIPYAPIPGAGTPLALGDDQMSGFLPLGFTFNFYGINYTQVRVSSNGFMTFQNTTLSGCCSGQNLPNAADPDAVIAFNWEDLNPSAGGTIEYFTTGVAPNRIFVMNFNNVPHFGSCGQVTAQVLLYEATGNIEIHGGSLDACGGTTTMGIEDETGSNATTVPGRNATAGWSGTNEGWLFAPPSAVTYLWTGQAIAAPTQLNTTANPTTSGNYVLTVTTNTGCTASDTVPVNILPLPFNLTPNNLQTTATDFRWNSGNPGSAYTVYWGAVGFIPSGAGQLGQTSGTSIGGVNTTGTATATAVVSQGNTVSNSTASQVFNVPAGGNITSATLNLRARGDLDIGGATESLNALIDGNLVAFQVNTTAQCGSLEPVGAANIDVTALLQGNPTVNLEFFITAGVSGVLCTPAPANELEWTFTVDTVVAGPTTATGLLPNTTYQFYVEEDCGITGPINFTTPIGCFWLGNNSNWGDSTNWSAACGGVPRGCGAPDITVGPTSNDPIVSVDDSLNNIDILAGASVTIDPTINLFVCGDWDNQGTFSHGDGRVVMQGDTSQQIIGTSTFGFLEIDNQSGNDVSLAPGAQVSVTEGLVMTNENLNIPSGAMVTIISDAGGTGYVDDFTSGTAGSIVGNITMQRLVRNTGAGRAFYYISSAVGGTGVSDWNDDFDTQGRLYGAPVGNSLNGRQVIPTAACLVDSLDANSPYGGLFEYIESAVTGCTLEGWHVKSSGGITAGEGYAGIIPDGVVVDVTGPANTGTINWPVTITGTNTATPGFNLAGNPYPSAIDWAQVVTDNAGVINGTAYLWQSTGFYAGVTLPLNVMISGDIGSSQGFEVEALVNGNLSFNQGQRTTGDPAFVRSAPLWDQRLDLIIEGNNFADLTNIVFSGVSTDGFDGWYDSYKREVNSFQPSIWTKLNGDDMSINSFADFDGSEVVDLSMVPGQTGTYTIRAEYLETFDATTLVFLEDKQEGVIHCLNFAPSYTFNSDVNDAPDRFLVYFTPPAQIATVDASCSGNDGSMTIDLGVFSHAGATFQWDTYQVLDNNNNVIATGNNANGVINVSNVTAGSYTLVLGYQGNTVTEQIVVDGDQAVLAAFNVVGTQHFAGDPIDFTNTTTGANDHTWDFGDGTILTGVVNPTYAYALPGTYLVKLISTNDDGCQDISTTTVEVSDKTTGIGGVEDDMLRVYGADNTIFVDVIDVTEPVTDVKVFDMTGKMILSTEVEGQNLHSIPMEEAAGYYIVRAENGDLTISRKVLIIE